MTNATVVAVDGEKLRRLLKQIEATAHRGGWDGPPELYGCYDVAGYPETDAWWRMFPPDKWPAVRRDGYLAKAIFPARVFPGGRPPDALRRVALNMTFGEGSQVEAFRAAVAAPGFLGMAFRCEVWTLTGNAEEIESARAAASTDRLADTIGSVEARMVWAADVAGASHAVFRTRGKPPRTCGTDDTADRDGTAFGAATGYAVDSLLALVGALAGQPRPDLLGATTP